MEKLTAEIEKQIEELAAFTATPGKGVTRLTYSAEDRAAREYIKEQMADAGLLVREDGMGNIFGRLEGTLADAPAVLVGSHFDSVPNGGAYDGGAGVVAGLQVAALFKENELQPKYPLEIVALVEEEGSRFGGGLMGSRGMTGALDKEAFAALRDRDGISTVDAMRSIGLDPEREYVRDPGSLKAFLELHIEQGPYLEEAGVPIGVVEAIVGLTQLEVTVKGQAGHAGTTPMNRRADALVTAAKVIAQLPDLAVQEGEGTVITTGRLNVFPNGANVIPDKVIFTIDIRSGKEEHVLNVTSAVKDLMNTSGIDGIEIHAEEKLYIEPKMLDSGVRSLLTSAADKLGFNNQPINSGAGHDAMVLSDITKVGMLFIPSKNGLSHCPEEWSDAADIAKAVQILFEAAKQLTEAEAEIKVG